MKKKLLITLIAVVTITLSATAARAASEMSTIAKTNDGTWVQKFTDGDTDCYVVERHTDSLYPIAATSESNGVAISCVRTK